MANTSTTIGQKNTQRQAGDNKGAASTQLSNIPGNGLFTTQYGIRGSGISNGGNGKVIDYSQNNLFAGVWETNQGSIDRFDHFLGGYGYFFWTKPCRFMGTEGLGVWENFKAISERNLKSFEGIQDFSLENDSITHGIAGNEFPVITNMKKDITTFTLKHQEMEGSPMREFYQIWVTGIRDPETGLAHYHGLINKDSTWTYSLANHSAECLFVLTDPSGARNGDGSSIHNHGYLGIEFACYFTAVFPTRVPQQHLNYSAGDHAPAEIDMEFKGLYHQSSAINDLAVEYMKKYYIKNMYGHYDPHWAPGKGVDQIPVVFDEGYNESGRHNISGATDNLYRA